MIMSSERKVVIITGASRGIGASLVASFRKRGYAVVINRTDKARGSVYRIDPSEIGGDSAALHTAAEATGKARPVRPERSASPRSRQAA